MKNHINILSVLTILFIFTSCEKEIDVKLNSVEPKIVIEGTVVKDSLAQVRITKTKDFNTDNYFPPVTGAKVTISDSDGNREVLTQNSSGIYIASNLRGKENTTYWLEVIVDDEVFTSTSTMPEEVDINNIKMFYIPSFGYAVPMVVFQAPPGAETYYRNLLYLNRTRMDIGDDVTYSKNREGLFIERILPVYDDNKPSRRKVEKGDTVLVELQCIDKGVYTFFDSLGRMTATQNNPTSNISGGALGYFSAYSFDKMQMIADW